MPVQQPKRAPEFVQGKKNTVLNVIPVQMFAVSYVDDNSQKGIAIAIVFGSDVEDGGAPGVYIMADETDMVTQLKIPTPSVKKGVRAFLAQQTAQTADEIPESAGSAPVAAAKPKAKIKATKPPQKPTKGGKNRMDLDDLEV